LTAGERKCEENRKNNGKGESFPAGYKSLVQKEKVEN
jgi:hypothetical protein